MAPCFSFENNCLCSVPLPVCRIGLILIHRYVVIHRLINSKIIFAQLHKCHKTNLNFFNHTALFVVVRNSESFHFTCSPICQQSSILISSLQPFDGFGMVWFIKPCHICIVKMPCWTIGFTDKELVQRSLEQLVCMHLLYNNLKISSHNNKAMQMVMFI